VLPPGAEFECDLLGRIVRPGGPFGLSSSGKERPAVHSLDHHPSPDHLPREGNEGRGRNGPSPFPTDAPPAQSPAIGTTALGSHRRFWRRIARRAKDALLVLPCSAAHAVEFIVRGTAPDLCPVCVSFRRSVLILCGVLILTQLAASGQGRCALKRERV